MRTGSGSFLMLAYTHSEIPPCVMPCSSSDRTLILPLSRDGHPSGQPAPVEWVREMISDGENFALLQSGVVNLVRAKSAAVFSSVPFDDRPPYQAALTWDGSFYQLLFADSKNAGVYLSVLRITREGKAEAARLIGIVGPGPLLHLRTAATRGSLLAPEAPLYRAARVVLQQSDGTTEIPGPPRRRAATRR